jgi:hypothetical protein
MTDTQVSPATYKKLEDAMQRLLSGKSRRTDGALTKNNLYIEAGVSRATMNRATDLLSQWDLAVSDRNDNPCPADEAKVQLSRDLRKSQEAARALRSDLNAAATVIQALYAENVSLREKLARLQKKNVPKLGR